MGIEYPCRWSAALNDLGSIIPPEFNRTAFFPFKDNAFVVYDDQPPGNEARMLKFFGSDLSLPRAGPQVGAPGNLPGGHIFVARYFDGLHLVAYLFYAYHLIVMAGIMANPFAA